MLAQMYPDHKPTIPPSPFPRSSTSRYAKGGVFKDAVNSHKKMDYARQELDRLYANMSRRKSEDIVDTSNNEIYEKINYYATTTPNSKRGRSAAHQSDSRYNLPTPNILKYSSKEVTPSKHPIKRRGRDSSEVVTPSQLGHPIASLRMDVPVQDITDSPFKTYALNGQRSHSRKGRDKS